MNQVYAGGLFDPIQEANGSQSKNRYHALLSTPGSPITGSIALVHSF
jgi:hypothetical protein